MTSALEKSVRNTRSRTRPVPISRDQQIYLDYQTTGKRQTELAEQYELTQCRISQIIRRVEKWLTTTSDLGPGTLDTASLERRLQSGRLNEAARLALQHFHDQQKTVTHKKGTRGSQKFEETTERLLPPNIQCLKVVLQATAQQSRLVSSRHTPCTVNPISSRHTPCAVNPSSQNDPSSPTTDNQRREQVEDWLTQNRDAAARAHKVPWDHNPRLIIQDLVSALLGEPHKARALRLLAHEAGYKLVKRKSYDDEPLPLPPQDGWYYAMYDPDGGLVGWLNADQVASAISPDYPPVSRSNSTPLTSAEGDHDKAMVVQPDDGLQKQPPDDSSHSAIRTPQSALAPSPRTTSSTTSPPANNPPQPPPPPTLTPAPPQTTFSAPIVLPLALNLAPLAAP